VQAVGGHPGFVEEYLRELGTLALLDVRGGVASLHAEAELPKSIEELSRRTRATLGAAARRTLEVVAASGGAQQLEVIAAVLGLATEAADAAALELARGGLARFDEVGRLHVAKVHHPKAHDPALYEALARRLCEVDGVASAEHFERAGLMEEAGAAWHRAARELAGVSPIAALDAASRALSGRSDGATLAERLQLVATLLAKVRALPPILAENLGGALERMEADAPTEAASVRMQLVDGMIDAGAFELALILQDQAVALAPELAAAAVKRRALVAVRAASPQLAADSESLLDLTDAAQLLDATEIAWLRGDRARVQELLERAPAPLTLEERVRWGRLDLRVASEGARKVDELTALAQALRPHREVAEVFLAAADALREDPSARGRVASLLQETVRFAEEAGHERCRAIASSELALLTRGRAAADSVLAAAARLSAEGDFFGALELRVRVAKTIGTSTDAIREEARAHDLAGVLR
jgi:hypothetical protein